MNERLCNLFESCETPEAPLCPIQASTVKKGIWYPDEPICQSKQFQDLPWIRKQHQIAALKRKTDIGFFTVRMLDAVHIVTSKLRGADPDDSNAESKWLEELSGRRATVTEKRRQRRKKTATRQKQKTLTLFKI